MTLSRPTVRRVILTAFTLTLILLFTACGFWQVAYTGARLHDTAAATATPPVTDGDTPAENSPVSPLLSAADRAAASLPPRLAVLLRLWQAECRLLLRLPLPGDGPLP